MKSKKKKPITRQRNGTSLRVSMCRCGHVGDAPFSAHADTKLEKGHGRCLMDGCPCEQFTWKEYP